MQIVVMRHSNGKPATTEMFNHDTGDLIHVENFSYYGCLESAYSVYQIDDRYCLYGKKYRFENGRIIKEDHRYFMANNQCKWLAATDTTKGDKQ